MENGSFCSHKKERKSIQFLSFTKGTIKIKSILG